MILDRLQRILSKASEFRLVNPGFDGTQWWRDYVRTGRDVPQGSNSMIMRVNADDSDSAVLEFLQRRRTK